MSTPAASHLDSLKTYCREIHALDAALSLMGWDRQVMMPANGGDARTGQMLALSQMRHHLSTRDELGTLIHQAATEAETPEDLALIRVTQKTFERETKFSADFVGRKEQIGGEAYQAWRVAKPANDFATMAPFYTEIFELERETAEILGYTDHIYDALIDQYEEGSTYAEAKAIFDQLQPASSTLLQQIRESKSPISDTALHQEFDPANLRNVVQTVLRDIGFDFRSGRLDICANAFCSGTTFNDVRMTTRHSDHIKGILSSSLHEMGHGLYEQGQNPAWTGLPISGGVSLAVHESQSRTWENVVGRSQPFWKFFFPRFADTFPHLGSLGEDGFYRSYNKVEPSFVRVGADEISYNLHILVRFELEVELITGKLEVKDLPEAWNHKYTQYLGVTPLTDTLGCLQDVHWCRGSVGYFPTYTLGNLIGLQVWNTLQSQIGNQDENMAVGNFEPMLSWLTENMYLLGSLHTPKDLVKKLTGSAINAKPWLTYATDKFGGLYNL